MAGVAKYRYLVCDLLTDQLVAVPPLTGVSFDRRISRPGSFKGSWKIANRNQAVLANDLTQNAGRLAIWVLRNDVLWWGGILWDIRADPTARSADTVAFTGSTFDSYPYRRIVISSWATGPPITAAQDIHQLWDDLQLSSGESYDDIGVLTDLVGAPTEGEAPVATFYQENGTTYGKIIESLTDSSPGCEYTIDVYLDSSSVRQKQVRTSYPTFASPPQDVPFIVTGYRMPSWTQGYDATQGGTVFSAQGDQPEGNTGQDQRPLISADQRAQELLDLGWPHLDVRVNYEGVISTVELNRLAQADRDRMKGPRAVAAYTVHLRPEDEWHPNNIGQPIQIQFSKQDLWRPGQHTMIRPVAAQFSPPDQDSQETVKLSVDINEEG